MLKKVLEIIEIDKLIINNIDITVLSQVINISKISDDICSSLSNLLKIEENVINVKGKSFDHLGVIGDGTASACIALVSVENA
jgi:2-C-methyl-D-erythritol 4-phosphate cytidylyltransferase/2-C-methyl-D-erythritol 2,4-cyclodiphosphate synthase